MPPPPFQIPSRAGSTSSGKSSNDASNNAASGFASMMKSSRGWFAARSSSGPGPTSRDPSPTRERDAAKTRLTGSSSRGAGVKPKRQAGTSPSPKPRAALGNFAGESELSVVRPSQSTRREGPAGNALAGPSRGGFIVQATKSAPTVAASGGFPDSADDFTHSTHDSLSLMSASHIGSPVTSPSMRGNIALPPVISIDSAIHPSGNINDIAGDDDDFSLPIPPPSKILPRLIRKSQLTSDTRLLAGTITRLAQSVELYPFPPPSLAAENLASALSEHPATSPSAEQPPPIPPGPVTPPSPTPLQIYASQADHLKPTSTPVVRKALLELMRACIVASLASRDGMLESEKAVFWEHARQWAVDGKVDVTDPNGGTRWVLPDEDRESLVAVLSALTREGKNLSDVPGLVSLLCTFITDSLPNPGPPSPLFDPSIETCLTEVVPTVQSRHASALTLLTSLHKFSAPHIYATSTLNALRAVLDIACLQEERDLVGVLDFLGAVVRYGEVSGERGQKRPASDQQQQQQEPITDENRAEGEVILRKVVAVVARMVGCEGLVGVVQVKPGQTVPDPGARVRSSVVASSALDLMRDLLKSPANQALKSLRANLIEPPADVPPPQPPILLLVGALRSLRKALLEHALEVEASRAESSSTSTADSRWPSMLSLGLPFLWVNLTRVMKWKAAYVDCEVLKLMEERVEAADRAAVRTREPSRGGAGGTERSPETEEGSSGVSYEEWDMVVDVLATTKHHIAEWEESNKRPWIWRLESEAAATGEDYDDDEEDEYEDDEESPNRFKQRPGVMAAFTSLLTRLVQAWRSSDFAGPSERVFNLLMSLAPHLSDDAAQVVIELCDEQDLCLPTHPDWLERVSDVARAFFYSPDSSSRPPISNATRRRALSLLSSLHSHLRDLDSIRQILVSDVLLPLLEASLEAETDVDVVEGALVIIVAIARDVLPLEDVKDSGGDVRSGLFDRIRLLLFRVAQASGTSGERVALSAAKAKRGNGPSSMPRYMESSSSNLRASPSISAPGDATSSGQGATSHSMNDAPFKAALALTSIFHLCLARSTPASSEMAVAVFRNILSLLLSSPDSEVGVSSSTSDPAVPTRIRLLVLSWLVRLRADGAHRVHWIKDVDISQPASILHRLASSTPTAGAASESLSAAVGRGADEPDRSEARGRSSRTPGGDRAGREASMSRLGPGHERSPSRSTSHRRGVVSTSSAASFVPLWTYPEKLPFDFGDNVGSIGGKGLVSFDHNRLMNWTETEDEETGQYTTHEVEVEGAKPTMSVLPVSEYLRAIHQLLMNEKDFELVSYLLCHLPEQLSNKHFSAGPRAATQIRAICKLLCGSLQVEDASPGSAETVLPPNVNRSQVRAAGFLVLSSLIAYASLLHKTERDSLVETFLFGFKDPRDAAKVCIHALAIASFELPLSMTKHLSSTVKYFSRLISSPNLGVHVLELIAGVGQQPALYANFTDSDFKVVFGIALEYIKNHNVRVANNPESLENQEGTVEYAFSQYVFLLAYYSIAAWFLALRVSERRRHVEFITSRLVQANEGKPEIDGPTEVCFDMIARYTYTNADPRPRHSTFDRTIISSTAADSSLPPPPSKTWIVGSAAFTIQSLASPGWVEVTVRRASGVVRMLWELQNISGVRSSSDSDHIAMYLRHRDSFGLSSTLPSIAREALSTSAATNSAAAGSTPNGSTAPRDAATAAAAQNIVDPGLLTVDPAFFALQMSAFPDIDRPAAPLLLLEDPALQRGLASLDRIAVVDFHKIGVVYVGPGQRTEQEILANTHGSKSYINLISKLGKLIRLKGSRDLDVNSGGLSQVDDSDGKWMYMWDDEISQVIFHVTTLMPTNLEKDPQVSNKKRHIGNNYVKIIYNDSGQDVPFGTFPSQFEFVNIVIEPQTPVGNPWMAPGMINNVEYFKITMQCRPDMPEIGPLGAFKMVQGVSLPDFVRQLSLHSNIFAQVWLDSVGIEARSGRQTLEYTSNWRARFQAIKMLKQRELQRRQQLPDPPAGPLDMNAAEMSREFTAWCDEWRNPNDHGKK